MELIGLIALILASVIGVGYLERIAREKYEDKLYEKFVRRLEDEGRI